MIRGRVNADLQPFVSLQLRTKSGEFERFEFKLDTGFNGELGLSSSTLERLKKSFVAELQAIEAVATTSPAPSSTAGPKSRSSS